MKKVLIFFLILILALLAYVALKPQVAAPTTDTASEAPGGATSVRTDPNAPDYQPQPTGQTTTVGNSSGADYQPRPSRQTQILQHATDADYQPQ